MRYFYKDSLAAAWMAKHFGMRFVDYSLSSPEFHVLPFVDAEIIREYQIHPDSLHLLEPREEDIFKNELGSPVLIRGGTFGTLALNEVKEAFHDFEIRIIQRRDIAFHWPEVEQ